MNTATKISSSEYPEDFAPYLRPGVFVDSDHAEVIAFARDRAGALDDVREAAVRLYYAVRDEFLYDPYGIDTNVEALKASNVLRTGKGFCVPKAALLAAAARAVGIPARVGYADVRNHEFDVSGRRHMEYLRDRGTFADLPREAMLAAWAEHYPGFEHWSAAVEGDFQSEAERN